jgi:hypothetical protein
MAADRVTGVQRSAAPLGSQPMGISAQLAQMRSQMRAVMPAASWDDIVAEAKKLQEDRGITLLAALQIVYEKLLSGWVPPRR